MTALDAIARDLRSELEQAAFVVADPFDADLLDRLDLRAALHVPHGELLGYVLGVGAADVVLLAGTDPRLATWLSVEVPHLRIRCLPIDSPLLALGGKAPTTLDDADRLRTQWLDLSAEHARLADLDHERADVPAAAPRLAIRRAGR